LGKGHSHQEVGSGSDPGLSPCTLLLLAFLTLLENYRPVYSRQPPWISVDHHSLLCFPQTLSKACKTPISHLNECWATGWGRGLCGPPVVTLRFSGTPPFRCGPFVFIYNWSTQLFFRTESSCLPVSTCLLSPQSFSLIWTITITS
jgi:hypothetical protein